MSQSCKQLLIVTDSAEDHVTSPAEKSSNVTACVAVIYGEAAIKLRRMLATDGANATLRRKHFVVLLSIYSIGDD